VNILVVGSGASAVHFAQSALEKGHEVTMVDVGRERPAPVRPGDSFEDLKRNLDDPVAHLLGENFEAVTYPGGEGEFYGFPPNKSYVFEGITPFQVRASGFAPLVSFAQGGLAEAWTAGVFPFREEELADFPFSYDDLAPFYDLVARRIGISGTRDDLAELHPVHDHLLPPLDLDEHSRVLLERYEAKRETFRSLGVTMGRSRIATLSEERDGRPACEKLGRCLLGCPTESLYTPLVTLRELLKHERFTYRGGLFARRFEYDSSGRISVLVTQHVRDGEEEKFPVEHLVLGAGTLSSANIVMESWFEETGEILRLSGLMDNRQVLMPFVNPRLLRHPHDPETYQYHQITIGLEGETPRDLVHGLLTTLKSASIHPVVQGIPLDVGTSLWMFRNLHAALGLVNINFADRRRKDCYVTLGGTSLVTRSRAPALRIHYERPAGERRRLRRAKRRFRRALSKLGCFVPPRMSHVRPMGSSVHYAGTLPMSEKDEPFTTTPDGRSRDFENLWIVDATTFPFLPAKNLTFTLMANAARIADRAF
jgi:choline dehydrogenase-like flavoprotein